MDIRSFLYFCILLTEYVFSPSTGETSGSVKIRVHFWQTDDIYILRVFDRAFQDQYSVIVVKCAGMIALVNHDFFDVAVLMRVDLVLRLRVPFSRADFEFVWLFSIDRNVLLNQRNNEERARCKMLRSCSYFRIRNNTYFYTFIRIFETRLILK